MAAAVVLPSRLDVSTSVNESEHRLPLDVKPIHYDVTIRTDLEKLDFDGWVSIRLHVLRETSKLIFNSSGLELSDIVLHNEEKNLEETPLTMAFDTVTERAIVEFPSVLQAGLNMTMQAKFKGPLTADMAGYYRSSWKNDGKEEYYSLTQFQSTAARRGFPCWDEPLLKATFSISMISKVNFVNLSNMNVISEEPYDGDFDDSFGQWKMTRFEKSPPMSTYLVAYACGPFEYIESSYLSPLSGKTRPLRVYATKDNIPQAQFALDVKCRVMPLYEKMFDVEYPLPKLDTLIVNDFDMGAMENWGLITGRTNAFCLDPSKRGVAAQKRIATVQSHEVAHMWFGNITTMAWWDSLYLNEGFATLMGSVIITGEYVDSPDECSMWIEAFFSDKIFPEWNLYSEFIVDDLDYALLQDAKLSSHPIEMPCPDANHAKQIFDSMSYYKAASVLRMLAAYVGEKAFLQGVSIYLKRHLYANSVSSDLWDSISEAAGHNVTTMMNTWVSKVGFPMVTVKETPNSIIVQQDRFLNSGCPKEEDNQTIWEIPLNFAHLGSDGGLAVDRSLVLDAKKIEIPWDMTKPFKLNYGTSAFCHVLYSPERMSLIAKEVIKENTFFSMDDRIGLVLDSFALAKAGHAEISTALNLVDSLRKEEHEYLVWKIMRDHLGILASVWWEDDHISDLLCHFRRVMFTPLIAKLGYDYTEGESSSIKELRTLAISGAAAAEELPVIHELQRRFYHMLETGDDSAIALDLERAVYTTVIKHGGEKEYDAVRHILENPRTPSTRTAAIAGLCSTKVPELLDRTFKHILSDARKQDYTSFIVNLANNRDAVRKVASFMKENFDYIYEQFHKNMTLDHIVSYSFRRLTSEADAKDIEDFFKGKDISKFHLSLHQTLDTIRANAVLIKKSSEDIISYLEKWTESHPGL